MRETMYGLEGAMAEGNALVQKCLEIRRIWQGPGQHSHELAAVMGEMFKLLPDEGPALTVHVSDSLAVRSRFGGQ